LNAIVELDTVDPSDCSFFRKRDDARRNLLDKSVAYFQLSHFPNCDYLSTSKTPRPRLYRGSSHIWQVNDPFQVGDLIDCMDKEKSWFESYITDILPEGSVEVHFMGWGSKWDDVVLTGEFHSRIAPLNSKTINWRSELFEGGLIEIKCNEDTVNQKWMWGKVLALSVEEEWIDVAYTFGGETTIKKRAHLYGENICPIGMHTKDKSKIAAASVLKPAKKVDELIRSKLDVDCDNDLKFLDEDDDSFELYHVAAEKYCRPKSNTTSLYSFPSDGLFSENGLGNMSMIVFDR